MVDPARQNADADAVERVLAGEIDAFGQIVRRWQGPIVDLAYRFCRERGLAEEIAQDAFLKAFRSLSHWRREARFSTWLYAIAVNVARSRLRRWQPDWTSLDRAAELADPRRPDEVYEAVSEAERVRRAVIELPTKYREAIVLFYFHEMDIVETAATLGVPEGTIKARLHRGRAMLRRRFETEQVLSTSVGVV